MIPLWIVFFLMQSSASSSALRSLEVGMDAPPFSLQASQGGSAELGRLIGKRGTLLLFWATWGENSVKALREMERLYRRYRQEGLSVVGINVDRQEVTEGTLRAVQATATELQLSFPLLLDRGLATFNAYGVIAVPTTVFIDGTGIIRAELSGFPLVGSEAFSRTVVSAITGQPVARGVALAGRQPDKRALRLWSMGVAALRSQRTSDQAKGWFERAEAADPSFIQPYLSLGELYARQHDQAAAERQYGEALRRQPEHAVALCALGEIRLDRGDLAGARQLLQRCLAADEAYLPAYYLLGAVTGRQGELAAARQWFERAERLSPYDYRIFFQQGMLYEARREPAAAAAAYRKALEVIVERHVAP